MSRPGNPGNGDGGSDHRALVPASPIASEIALLFLSRAVIYYSQIFFGLMFKQFTTPKPQQLLSYILNGGFKIIVDFAATNPAYLALLQSSEFDYAWAQLLRNPTNFSPYVGARRMHLHETQDTTETKLKLKPIKLHPSEIMMGRYCFLEAHKCEVLIALINGEISISKMQWLASGWNSKKLDIRLLLAYRSQKAGRTIQYQTLLQEVFLQATTPLEDKLLVIKLLGLPTVMEACNNDELSDITLNLSTLFERFTTPSTARTQINSLYLISHLTNLYRRFTVLAQENTNLHKQIDVLKALTLILIIKTYNLLLPSLDKPNELIAEINDFTKINEFRHTLRTTLDSVLNYCNTGQTIQAWAKKELEELYPDESKAITELTEKDLASLFNPAHCTKPTKDFLLNERVQKYHGVTEALRMRQTQLLVTGVKFRDFCCMETINLRHRRLIRLKTEEKRLLNSDELKSIVELLQLAVSHYGPLGHIMAAKTYFDLAYYSNALFNEGYKNIRLNQKSMGCMLSGHNISVNWILQNPFQNLLKSCLVHIQLANMLAPYYSDIISNALGTGGIQNCLSLDEGMTLSDQMQFYIETARHVERARCVSIIPQANSEFLRYKADILEPQTPDRPTDKSSREQSPAVPYQGLA